MRITFLLPPLTLSGGIKAARRIADGLVERGHDVSLVAADGMRPWPPVWRPRTFARRARDAVRARSDNRGAFLDGSKARVIRLDKREHAVADVPDGDVVIATWWETAESLRNLPDSKGRKFYFVQADETNLSGPEARERVIATYRSPFRHICVSTFLADMMKNEYGHKNVTLAHIGVDDIFFRGQPRARNTPPAIGVLYAEHPLKGWDVATRAIQMLRERVPRVSVSAFGASALDPRHRLDDMTFEQRPPQARIVELSSAVDVWLLSSVREGFGLPPIEAAATGTPIVATRCGGPADYVRMGENGFLVDVGDAAGMAEALYTVLTCDPERWKAMSRESVRIAETFRWTQTFEKFEHALLEG